MNRATSFALAVALAACASEKTDLDPGAINSIDVNEAKEDSFRFPTLKGALAMGESVNGRVTQGKSFHAYDFTYEGAAADVRLDATSTAGRDLVVAAYRRTSTSWVLESWNDDCDDTTLNACLTLSTTGGQYRFIVATYEALNGHPTIANYSFSITCGGGACATQNCGGIAGLQCDAGEYCAYSLEATCGAADQMGTCEPMPSVCTDQYEPVCGCDGQTYGNACAAASAGVAVSSLGECAVACGARAGDTCAADQYCHFERIAICGQADGQGVCQARPGFCAANVEPVCGCDNQTYSNECAAAAAGQGVLHDGACP